MTEQERDKIRAAAEKVLSAGKMNVMLLPCAEIIALLDALDEAEKDNKQLRTTIGGIHEAIFDDRDVTKWKVAEWLNKALAENSGACVFGAKTQAKRVIKRKTSATKNKSANPERQ